MCWQELTTELYPWDLHDEGIEAILDNLQSIVGCNAVYLTALMHSEKRPLHDNTYPHNPVRKRYLTEDAVAYWKPYLEMYEDCSVVPVTSERDFLKDTDWLGVFVKATHSRGMKAGVAISHTPLNEQRPLETFSDCIQRDVFGNMLPCRPVGQRNYFHAQQLCWNSLDARKYIQDLVTQYDFNMYQVSNLFNGGHPELNPLLGVTLGGCFCDNCAQEATRRGLDWDLIKRTVRRYAQVMMCVSVADEEDWLLLNRGDSSSVMLLLEPPELFSWLLFRCETIISYFRGLSEAVHKAKPGIDFRFNTCWPNAEHIGLRIAPSIDSIRTMDYAQQTGRRERVESKGKWLSNVRRGFGEDTPIISAIAPRGKATPEMIKLGIKIVAKNGADGLSFGFYDGATMENLRAIHKRGYGGSGDLLAAS
jgi:hypothetical protein